MLSILVALFLFICASLLVFTVDDSGFRLHSSKQEEPY
jgi:hypothetical protein